MVQSTTTFLEAVNLVAKRVGVIQGATGDFTSLSSLSSRQRDADTLIQLWNETMLQQYDFGVFAGEIATATLTGVSGTREYAMPTDFERFAGNHVDGTDIFRGATNQMRLRPYDHTDEDSGYQKMLRDQLIATDWSGTPIAFAVNPVTWSWRLNTENDDSNTATSTWNILYEKRLEFTATSVATTDVFPFSDGVVDSLVPVVAQNYDKIFKDKFDPVEFRMSGSRAARRLAGKQVRPKWGIRYRKRIGSQNQSGD